MIGIDVVENLYRKIIMFEEGRNYIVYSKKNGNAFTVNFRSWDDVEEFVCLDENVYKILSLDVCDMPIMGIRERNKND